MHAGEALSAQEAGRLAAPTDALGVGGVKVPKSGGSPFCRLDVGGVNVPKSGGSPSCRLDLLDTRVDCARGGRIAGKLERSEKKDRAKNLETQNNIPGCGMNKVDMGGELGRNRVRQCAYSLASARDILKRLERRAEQILGSLSIHIHLDPLPRTRNRRSSHPMLREPLRHEARRLSRGCDQGGDLGLREVRAVGGAGGIGDGGEQGLEGGNVGGGEVDAEGEARGRVDAAFRDEAGGDGVEALVLDEDVETRRRHEQHDRG